MTPGDACTVGTYNGTVNNSCECFCDDADGDTICDTVDVCAGSDDRVDQDFDGVPDGCDICPASSPDDADGDNVCDNIDNCPAVSNADQADTNTNGV